MKQVSVYTLLLLNIIAVIAIGMASVSVFISPAVFWIPALFGMAYPYLLVVNVIFVILWLFTRPKYALISLVVILAGYNNISNYLQLSGEKTDERGIRVISYNVKYFMGMTDQPNKENADQILYFLRKNDADIICLQEVRLNKRQIFDIKDTRLPMVNHMQLAHNSHAGGPLTMTRFPIAYMGEIRFKNSGNMIIYTDILINGTDTTRVFNCHLQSYRLQKKEINTIDSINFDNHRTREKILGISAKFKDALVKRAEQAAILNEHIRKSPYPVIVCGDFNDTPVSYAYHTVKGNLEDSFTQSGSGTANTYNGKLPSFRIDYILYSPSFKSYNFEVSLLDHSDHFPIGCELFPAEKQEQE
ncbi:MAG TPA: endonuclease/exonuclease/phosphatase family protein [Prolixibacteraceae bacterium]|nr:endonuclease/exonuclease/phosphatase family protein [Prolixibacteraceae bacterium]